MGSTVILYTQPNCRPCQAAKDFLSQKGITFVVKDVVSDEEAQRELIALGSRSTPTVRIGNQVMIGFSPAKILKALAS